MRIIGGKAKGTKLYTLEGNDITRPTLDRVKESIFNLIQFDVQGAVVLDLFAGTGALGIEAVSRGAEKVFFVDENKQAIKIVKENLQGMNENVEVINTDAFNFLKNTKQKFDIVLIDPPFKTDLGTCAIEYIITNNLLKENGIIIFETAEEKEFNFEYENFKIDRRKYGTVAVYKFVKD